MRYGSGAHTDAVEKGETAEVHNGVIYDENGTVHVRAQVLGEDPPQMIRRIQRSGTAQESFETYRPASRKAADEKQENRREIESSEHHRSGRILLVDHHTRE